jgi:ADP-ribose pyrophosphatase YjhB (NUDIX family)
MLTVTAGTLALCAHEGLLLVRTTRDPSLWRLPGGFLEPGETPEQAIEREVREELNCTFLREGYLGLYYKVYDQNISFLFQGQVVGSITPDPSEIEEARRWDAAALPHDMSPRHAVIVRDVLSRTVQHALWVFTAPTECTVLPGGWTRVRTA